ncbi:hypothetical protein [Prosthecochloris aestuarii]|nr:hypothetical protein [Prosthecochloris aestuarii]
MITLGARMREGGKMAEKATCFLKVLRVEGTVFPQGSLKSTAVRKEKKSGFLRKDLDVRVRFPTLGARLKWRPTEKVGCFLTVLTRENQQILMTMSRERKVEKVFGKLNVNE